MLCWSAYGARNKGEKPRGGGGSLDCEYILLFLSDYRDRVCTDSMMELAIEVSLPSSGISSSPAR